MGTLRIEYLKKCDGHGLSQGHSLRLLQRKCVDLLLHYTCFTLPWFPHFQTDTFS